MQVSDTLLAELDSLHPRQRTAVLHDGNVVLRAGPGSGKTRTLVARIAYVLQTQISAFRGVACITYTNAAAEEIRRRVLRSGVRAEGRITCSTVQAFVGRCHVGWAGGMIFVLIMLEGDRRCRVYCRRAGVTGTRWG